MRVGHEGKQNMCCCCCCCCCVFFFSSDKIIDHVIYQFIFWSWNDGSGLQVANTILIYFDFRLRSNIRSGFPRSSLNSSEDHQRYGFFAFPSESGATFILWCTPTADTQISHCQVFFCDISIYIFFLNNSPFTHHSLTAPSNQDSCLWLRVTATFKGWWCLVSGPGCRRKGIFQVNILSLEMLNRMKSFLGCN